MGLSYLRRQIFSCLFFIPLFAGVVEDELRKGIETLTETIREKEEKADPVFLEKARAERENFFSWVDSCTPDTAQSVVWDHYLNFVRLYTLLDGVDVSLNPQFVDQGFIQGAIDKDLNENFLKVFESVKTIPFLREDCDPCYLASDLEFSTTEALSQAYAYVMLEDRQLEALKPILAALKEPITECLGTPWRVVNVRAWKTPSHSGKVGPGSWHTDGMPSSLFKVMFYPLGANEEKGGVAFQLADEEYVIYERAGAWVFFKNSEIIHKGIPPKTGDRIAVEIALVPSLSYDLTPISAGQNARHPIFPWGKQFVSGHPFYKKGDVAGVNVGGGPNWGCPGWVNFEEVTSPGNPHSFSLFPNCRFPIENGSVQNVFTSHAIEHLNIPTVYRVLSESYRILEVGGNLIIKIPDYDKALDYWRRQDYSFFGPGWNIESVTPSWKTRETYDCLDYRAAMIFCSFFNDAFGNPFTGAPCPDPTQAYFGPPNVSIEFLRNLIRENTPSQIAKELRKAISLSEKNFHFVHQSAWNREELTTMLNQFGFEVFSFDPDLIIDKFGYILGMHDMRTISTFCWAKKKALD